MIARPPAPGPLAEAHRFDELARPALPAMRLLARRLAASCGLDPEDLVQETLERAWHKRGTYDPDRGGFQPWLLAILADRARQRRRFGMPRRPDPLTEQDLAGLGTADSPTDPDLHAAIRQLGGRQRQVVELYYLLDLDVTSVGAVLGIAPGTVRATLPQARARLRELWTPQDPTDRAAHRAARIGGRDD